MIYLWNPDLYPNKMSQVSSSKTLLTLRQLHLPLIHLQKDLLDMMEKLWPKRTIISFTPDQIQFSILLFYFLCPSLLLQLLISVQQSVTGNQPYAHFQWSTRSSPPPVLRITQQSQNTCFNLVTKSNAYGSLIILQVSTGMQVGNSVIYCS